MYSPKDLFRESLQRCSASDKFIPAFYERFTSSSDEILAKFEHTNFDRQNAMLLRSLELAEGATAGESRSLQELRERAVTHDRHHLDIRPELYDYWLAAIIETAQQFDNEWAEDVESAWREILSHVIDYMTRRY